MALLMALTGNFGRKGTGMRGWNTAAQLMTSHLVKTRPGLEGYLEFASEYMKLGKRLRKEDDTLSEEMVAIEMERKEVRGETITKLPPRPWQYLPPSTGTTTPATRTSGTAPSGATPP
ncbi:hypothetical protein LCGC14_2451970 [marine sediment metagenome]|uniref:Uncharacterized protein n=1 Tax=marine sediment metagenome TaxID=412755 RepID=A0A0F9E9T0_9ZZZZ